MRPLPRGVRGGSNLLLTRIRSFLKHGSEINYTLIDRKTFDVIDGPPTDYTLSRTSTAASSGLTSE